MQLSSTVTSSRSINYFKDLENRLLKKHNGKYSYHKAIFFNTKKKIHITCKDHGDFWQNVSDHLNGVGCPECGKLKCAASNRLTLKDFIDKSMETYSGKYTYDNTTLGLNNKTPVTVTCPYHGDFQVTPNNHMRGTSGGCPDCRIKRLREQPNIWSYTKWEQSGKSSKDFDDFKVYIVKCFNQSEEFIKIGKTYTTVGKRLNWHMPYEYIVLHEIKGTAKFISELENQLHQLSKQHSYIPLKEFGGQHECYSNFALEGIQHVINKNIKEN